MAQRVQTKRRFVSCVGSGRGPSSDGLVQQRGDVLLLVAVRGTEHHHAILQEAQRQRERVGELGTESSDPGAWHTQASYREESSAGSGSSPSPSLLSQAPQPLRHVQHP